MKKLPALFFYAFMLLSAGISCVHDNHNTSISYSENHKYYSMNAYFSNSKMREVEEYLDNKIGRTSNMSFTNARIDGTLALDDHTTFYIKKSAGTLKIKLDKDKNSDHSYQEIKSVCQGIKTVLAN